MFNLRVALLLCGLFFFLGSSAQVAINSTGAAPDNSAMLDISSTTKGVLLPSMTQNQRDVISRPAKGLLIFQTDASSGFYYYDGVAWQQISGQRLSSGSNIYFNGGNVGIGIALPGNKLEVNSGFLGSSGVRLTQMSSGSIPFVNSSKDLAQNNSALFWNASANSLGVGTSTPNSTVQVNGSYTAKFVTVKANYTASNTDYTIIAKPTTSSITIALPSAASAVGRVYIIKRVSLRSVIINPYGTELIDGATTYTISTNYNSLMIQSDGTAWYIMSNR